LVVTDSNKRIGTWNIGSLLMLGAPKTDFEEIRRLNHIKTARVSP
jgi:hypothetical protein